MPSTAVLLLAHGTPEDVSEIPDYLRNVTGGRAVPDSVTQEIQHRYSLIGRSPLTEITLRQSELLSQRLALPAYVGMRNWKPYIADTLHQMSVDGIERCVAVCLAPQNSRTSIGLYRSEVRKNAQDVQIDFVESWHDHPLLIAAFAERLESARAQHGREIHVLFTAHSVPASTIADGDPYEVQARQTGALVARALGLANSEWSFAFQSQGIAGGAWIGPTVEETMRSLKDSDHDRVLIQPVGFVSDHVEVLYDIDIGFRDYASQIGIEVSRPESLNDSPTFIAALADLVASRVQSEAICVSQLKSETKSSRARSE
jgi:ferrochelatase